MQRQDHSLPVVSCSYNVHSFLVALFIDEGFGTLDEDSIEDAMSILECVRAGNGMIGIISHVHLLEENIGTQMEVVKEESGNYIKMA